MAMHTGMKSLSLAGKSRWFSSQKSVIRIPFTISITKNGRPFAVAPASRTRAMFG